MHHLAWIYWNPDRVAFTIPFVNHAVVWYGCFFMTGFALGYLLIGKMQEGELSRRGVVKDPRGVASSLADRLLWYVIIGTLLGARLGHVFFYGWPYYRHHLLEIPFVWQGGLASHGGALGVLLALWIFQRSARKEFPFLTFLAVVDRVAIPTALVGCFIRLGNFWNQEILGVPSQLPWAVLFGSPMDGSAAVPRHPVQLYEALAYLATFGVLMTLWRRSGERMPEGRITGLFFLMVFGARFVLELFKEPLTVTGSEGLLQMGQWLSIPFVVLGLYLVIPIARQDSVFWQREKSHD